MKKIFLTAIALISIATTQVFGMYGVSSGDWIGFLTHGNQFRARLDQLGFTLGNDMIKGTFGFHTDRGNYGAMLNSVAANTETTSTGSSTGSGFFYNFVPTISMGLAYTSSLISVGVGYNATIATNRWVRYNGKTEGKTTEAVVHTPVLVLNALDNAFRMAIPIQVLHLTNKRDTSSGSLTAVSLDAQFRYYTGLEMLPQVRLYLKYGTYGAQFTPDGGGEKTKEKFAESFGFDLRFYFGSVVEEVALQPLVKLAYNGALGKQHNVRSVTALGALNGAAGVFGGLTSVDGTLSPYPNSTTYGAAWEKSAWDLQLMTGLGLTANSDIVSLYLEPELGLQIVQAGDSLEKVKETYGLGWDVYAEIYITPIKNLEWYFEAQLGNLGGGANGSGGASAITFNGMTGVTWYLPAL